MNKKNNGRMWPYIIGIAITLVFGFCVATVVVTSKAHIQQSDLYMTNYQNADAKANDYIKAKIAFDKKYNIEYITQSIGKDPSEVIYKITDKTENPVNDAELSIAVSRPETAEFNTVHNDPEVVKGVYTFHNVTFPKVGVWNIIAKVKIGGESRFYNMKADTRIKEAFEF